MAVTELALLHLKNNNDLDAPENENVKTALRIAIQKQAAFAGYPVYLFTQIEDPSYIYLLGGWDSVEVHVRKWIPSEENQQLLASVQEGLEVAWLQHIDIHPAFQSNRNGRGGDVTPPSAPVIAIGRYFVEGSKRGVFQDAFSANRHHLEAFTAPTSISAGWGLGPGMEEDTVGSRKEEFVLFSGWDAVEDHSKFAELEGFEDFATIKQFLDGADIKHAVRYAAS
ncbi:hypothetical protein UA08_07427 [Talaromyces atroroseus]|uniref:ABM domain-containing protein n=1 Tax=Talaromyces atroroseus TaxID=1441469 RepID=A0A225AV31_TALAT|nr:hypothetical protein UA08_07427 [Talaromyces atroroseus]OKL57337.1 hypothetical protein UA08_07427 [Talaromyces atroroseus]